MIKKKDRLRDKGAIISYSIQWVDRERERENNSDGGIVN